MQNKADALRERKVRELGHVLMDKSKGRTSDSQIAVVDLTGVAVQDIAIAKAILTHLTSK